MIATRTFLFSDLRDYTGFVEEHGDDAAATLIADYRRIVRAEIVKHEGAEVKTEGDSFYVVFTNARAAVACASSILRSADRYSRDRPDRPMRVGVGIHAGEPVPHEGQYVGSAVIIAARLAQNAKAGELLVTDLVRGLLPRHGLPALAERVDLKLKGIEEAPRIFAIGWKGVDVQPAQAAPTEVAIAAPPPESNRILCPVVMGRARELAELTSVWQRACAGEGRTALVSGEAGLGKSALLKLFFDRVNESGGRVMVGDCTEIEARRPFGPFIDAFKAAGIALPEDLAQDRLGGRPVATDERYLVDAGFADRIAEVAQHTPVVVAIEDLHWGDEATNELFPYLARKLRNERVLLLATYRTEDLRRAHPLNHVLAELGRGRLAEEVKLHKLTLEETGDVMRGALRLDRPPTPEFRQALWERTEGNPLFIEEILRALIENGDLKYKEGAWRRSKEIAALAIPLSVRDAVQQRLLRLSPSARSAIQIAATIGQRFDFELLREVSGLDEATLLHAIREAVDAQLLGEDAASGDDDAYSFRHALSRASVLADVLARERRALHRLIGEAIERANSADLGRRSEELAYHFDEARSTHNAFKYHDLAAAEAARAYSPAREATHLERAIELGGSDNQRLGELELRLAEAAYNAGDLSVAVNAGEAARSIYQHTGDDRGAGRATRQLSTYRWHLGETGLAAQLARESVDLLEPYGPSGDLASAYAELARLAMLQLDDLEAIRLGERAIALARETGEIRAEINALITVGSTRGNLGEPESFELVRQSVTLADRHGLIREGQRGYQNLMFIVLRTANASDLRKLHNERMAHALRFGVRFPGLALWELRFAFVDGDWDRVLRGAEDERDGTVWSAELDILAAIVLAARQGPEFARPLAHEARRRLIDAGHAQWSVGAANSGQIDYLAGDDMLALGAYQTILLVDEKVIANHPREAEPTFAMALAAAYRSGDDSAFRRWTDAVGTTRARTQMPATAKLAEALERAKRGEFVAAAEAILAIVDAGVLAMLDPVVGAILREIAAQLLDRAGERERASRALAGAIEWWRRVDARWYLRKIDEWAEGRGMPEAAVPDSR